MPIEVSISVIRDAPGQEELHYFMRNWNALVEQYRDKFVGVHKDKVVAVGDSWGEAYEAALKVGHKALVMKVDPDRWERLYV